MAKDKRIWLKNIKTGMVFPANPVMLKYPSPDMMQVRGPEDETPVRPIVEGTGADTSKWIDPESQRGKLMMAGIPEGASGDFDDEAPSSAPDSDELVQLRQLLKQQAAMIDSMSGQLKGLLSDAAGTPAAPEVPSFAPDTDVVGDNIVITPEQVEVNKMASMVDAIAQLDPADEAHYTKGGLPNATAITEKVGFVVTKQMRDEAYAKFQKG